MSKLSFRAKALDSSKPLAIYHSKEVDISHINRIVPKMPTGMEKEEESEHHLQRALAAGQAIPVPEVFSVQDKDRYKKCYPDKIKMPRQLIHMQPFSMQNDIPEYDMDSADEEWLSQQEGKLKITPLQFEDMIDKFERSCGTTAITLNDARSILKNVDATIVTSVYDYWLQKRISTQQPFIPQVKTDKGGGSNNNPYVAFRRRVERMTTRRNRKNDEVSYQKIVKLRRDLGRALDLFAMLKKREEAKKQYLQLGVSIFEKRFEMSDFNGSLLSDAARIASQKVSRPTFQPLTSANMAPISPASWTKEERKRPYKRRKRQPETSPSVASPPEELVLPEEAQLEAEEKFRFVRTVNCDFQPPIPFGSYEDDRSRARGGKVSFSNWTGMARRRIGRGGRVIYDRLHWDSLTPPHSPSRGEEPIFNQYFRPVSPVEEPELLEEEEFVVPKNVYIGFEESEDIMHFDLDNTDDFLYDFNLEPPFEIEDSPPVSSKWTRSSKSQELDLKIPVIDDEMSEDRSVGTSSDEIRLQLGNPVNEVF